MGIKHLLTAPSKAHFMDLRKFNYFIDVKRSRFSGIYPLPQRKFNSGEIELLDDASFFTKEGEPIAPEKIAQFAPLIHTQEKPIFGKQQLWERKLLDLSLRNNLLNLRLTRSSIQFIDVPIGELEDSLYQGSEFQILHKPKDWENTLRDEGIYQAYSSSNPLRDLVLKEFSQKRLRAYISEEELNSRLTFLFRSARHSLEENGANSLYLAIGILRWYESARSEKARFAPIILVPVDLIRKSVKVGYIIKGREEDAVLNITLLEKLRQDFGLTITGLDPLPTDESGVDVHAVFHILRQAVMNMSRWDVEEQFFLGTFSFNKFILWNDIHSHTDKLKQSPIVEGLLEGKLKESLQTLDLENLDLHYKPSDILLPIPADSSQMDAVCAAVEGNSYILHGPPGTGKSQTITNIIANALYRGKRVLFVAEKMAALSVVYSRLQSIGLDPFCLELHSNKARKAEVLSQLKSATEVRRRRPGFDFDAESTRLDSLKSDLDSVYQKLHQETFHGISLFEIFSRYVQYEGFSDAFTIPDQLVSKLEKANFPLFDDFLTQLAKAAELASDPSPNHPFFGVDLNAYSLELREKILALFVVFIDIRSEYLTVFESLILELGISKEFKNRDKQNLEKIVGLLLELPPIPDQLLLESHPQRLVEELLPLVQNAIANLEMEENIHKEYEKSVLSIDAESLLRQWKVKEQEWFLPRFFGLRKIKMIVQSYLNRNTKLASKDVVELLSGIGEFQVRKKALENNESNLKSWGVYAEMRSKSALIELNRILQDLPVLHSSIESIVGSASQILQFKKKVIELNNSAKSKWESLCRDLLKTSQKEQSARESLENQMGTEISFHWNTSAESGLLRAKGWKDHVENLKEWHAWTLVKAESKTFHLDSEIQSLENQGIISAQLKGSILRAAYKKMATEYLRAHPDLGVFSGEAFESRIHEFRKLNSQFAKLTKEMLFIRLAESIPDFSREGATSSETGILQRAIRNNGRGLSIRKLFEQISNLLPRISPCMLMSPISVAQYLDIHKEPFDLLIFDEASQMPTSEAVGAMARAKQLIIVGDPKQMPPTNFFSSVHIDEEDVNEDLESILDDCDALSVPSKQLKWHYRSKHESLIAFSNSKYYENSLFTFPSPDDRDTKVKFVKLNGVYDRGKTRQNLVEARAVVDELVRRIQLPIERRKSVGVVTFSSVQQTLIEDLLMERFKENPQLEEMALSFDEPYFIKNLENVQGDERDVILFSICYGPDASGYVALNFGPLNRDGGWRRLNVAVSRSRYEMIIYSSLTADQIDLNRSKAEGISGVKAFLAFAEKGKAYLPKSKSCNEVYSSKGIVKSIANFLISNGYQVELGVGSSGFKIDLGIIHPDIPGRYLLGILIDNKSHESSKSSIDRLLVQEGVLNVLGWKILKVWSLDWWESQAKEGARLLTRIEEVNNLQEQVDTPVNEHLSEAISEEIEAQHAIEKVESQSKNYKKASLSKVNPTSSDEFLSYIYTQRQLKQIKEIVAVEGPILKNLLGKRVLEAWDIGRMGGRLQKRFDELLQLAEVTKTSEQNGEECFWNSMEEAGTYKEYRVLDLDGYKRSIEEIPMVELINGLEAILGQLISLPLDDLIREGAKEFGFARTGNQVRDRITQAIQLMLKNSRAVEIDGRIKLN
jgi:DNA segregation ATPase FtsK/SpoIIIE-like protein